MLQQDFRSECHPNTEKVHFNGGSIRNRSNNASNRLPFRLRERIRADSVRCIERQYSVSYIRIIKAKILFTVSSEVSDVS